MVPHDWRDTMTERPDVPEYQHLELLEYGTEPDFVAAAVAALRVAMPEWIPRVGNTEVALLEGFALLLGPELMSIRMVEVAVTERLMGLYGASRDPGAPARGRAKFEVTGSAPIQIIPAGTVLRYTIDRTGETVDLSTVDELRILTSETRTGEVSVVSLDLGETPNGTPEGTSLEVVGSMMFVEAVETVGVLSGGAGAEGDSSFMSRASGILARQSSTLVLPESFQYAAASRPEVGRARVLDLLNPAAPGVATPGHVSVAVADLDGAPLSSGEKTAISNNLAEQALASLAIHVIDPTYTPITISASVRAAVGADRGVVKASAEAALKAWLSPATWPWASTVGKFAIASRLAAVYGVAEVLTVPETISLPGLAPLPGAVTATVTVTA